MSFVPATAASFDALDNDVDDEIFTQYRPVILKGLVKNWEITRAGEESSEALIQYMARFYTGYPLEIWIGPADIDGRFFYSDDMQGFNFERKKAQLPSALNYLFSQNSKSRPQAVYMGATSIAQCLPGMETNNQLDVVPAGVSPNIWMGNQVKISGHYDTSNNIACNVYGRRRFTLFPPEQISNLYVGPIDLTPAGQAISMVDINNPDLERFPRYKSAMKSAVVVDLEPGDALYIPPLWWHHVESLDAFNILINYWWNTSTLKTG
ncbi:MAG TPA: cupin-like domain-containing protein, partial [Cellvibrionaceae bacterium]